MRQILQVNYTFKSTSPPKNAENTVDAGFDIRVTGTHQIWVLSLMLVSWWSLQVAYLVGK